MFLLYFLVDDQWLCFIVFYCVVWCSCGIALFCCMFLWSGFFVSDLVALLMQSLKGRQDDAVLHELNEWRKEFIDVQAVMDEFIGLRTRASELRTEVSICLCLSVCVFVCVVLFYRDVYTYTI